MSRHAYLVTAYNDSYVLEQLFRLVDDDRNAIFIHLDKRFKEADPESLSRIPTRSPVVFVPRRKVFWGDYSQIAAVLSLVRAAVPGHYDYYHLVSGSDLPIKTQDEIHTFFAKSQGSEFIGYADDFDERWVTELHFFNRFMRPTNRFQRVIRNRGTNNILRFQRWIGYDHSRRFDLELRKGSDWFSITHQLALHLLAEERTIRRLLRFGHVPTEFYMQTLVWNSEFRARLYDIDDEFAGSARLIDWTRGGPYVFTEADFDELVASDRMFARKFVAAVDQEIVDRLVERLGDRE